ncbi:MAG TPA: hypothetical protein DIW34_03085 [Oribacterium sp.]|nr:hypothetical protein [Oribacterium sp.]
MCVGWAMLKPWGDPRAGCAGALGFAAQGWAMRNRGAILAWAALEHSDSPRRLRWSTQGAALANAYRTHYNAHMFADIGIISVSHQGFNQNRRTAL